MRRVPMTKHSVVMSGCNTLWLRRVDGPIGGGGGGGGSCLGVVGG